MASDARLDLYSYQKSAEIDPGHTERSRNNGYGIRPDYAVRAGEHVL